MERPTVSKKKKPVRWIVPFVTRRCIHLVVYIDDVRSLVGRVRLRKRDRSSDGIDRAEDGTAVFVYSDKVSRRSTVRPDVRANYTSVSITGMAEVLFRRSDKGKKDDIAFFRETVNSR